MKRYLKHTAFCLLFTMMVSVFPAKVMAEGVSEAEKKADAEEILKENPKGKIVGELVEKRDLNMKQFLKDDKTVEAVIYNEPVHYLKDGKWEEIDNSLEEKKVDTTVKDNTVKIKNEDNNNLNNEAKENKDTKISDEAKVKDASKENSEIKVTEKSKNQETTKPNDLIKTKDEAKVSNNTQTQEKEKEKEVTSKEKGILENVKDFFKKDNPKDNKQNIQTGKEEVLENKKNDVKVTIAKDPTSEKLVSISKDEYEVSWNLDGIKKSEVEIEKKDEKEIKETLTKEAEKQVKEDKSLDKKTTKEKEEVKEIIVENEEKKLQKNISSTVNFSNVFENIDLQYTLHSRDVKENLILNKYIENPKFKFNINVKNLVPQLENGNIIVFYDEKDSRKAVFKINAPFMYDSNKKESTNIKLMLEKSEKGYVLTLTPDNDWLKDKERAYPVTIDPVVETYQAVNKIQDTFVGSTLNPNPNYPPYTAHILEVGQGKTSGDTRSYLKFELPTLGTGDMVIDARLNLALYTTKQTASQINVHKVKNDWFPQWLTWAGQNYDDFYDKKVEDYQMVSGTGSKNWFQWNITGIVKEWYNTGKNYGVMLKNQDEKNGYTEFYSSDISEANAIGRPVISIQYVNNSGLENYWTYHAQNSGRAGTGYVNDYNGNLVFIHEDLSMSGNLLPLNIKHVYNSNDKTQSIDYGLGWRLNINQRIIQKNINNENLYEYIDEDGTRHYFKYNTAENVYKDESGGDLKLTINWDYTITDKKNNKLVFTSTGYLYKIVDNNANQIIIGYKGATPVEIVDGAGRITTLEVIENNYLIGIIDPAGRKTKFQYDGAKLSQITYPDNNYTRYYYDGNNNISSVENCDGYKVSYAYYPSSPYRVKTIEEGHKDGTKAGKLDLNYGYNTTIFTDYKGRKDIYQFDNSGRTVSVKESDDSALYYEYEDGDNKKNKTKLQSKYQKFSRNYLLNHNVESSGYWSQSKPNDSEGSTSFDSTVSYMGKSSLKVEKNEKTGSRYYSQPVDKLIKGQSYTFSAYVKTKDISSDQQKGAVLFIDYQDENGVTQRAKSNFVNGTKDWQRIEATFKLPDKAASTTVYAILGIADGKGTAYFDSLQFEEGTSANRYNLVENADLQKGIGIPSFWSKNSDCKEVDTLVTKDNKQAFKFIGDALATKNIYQKINVSGSKGDVISLGAWGLGNAVPQTAERNFSINLGFQLKSGREQFEVVFFNADTLDWQFASGRFIAEEDYNSIMVYGRYYKNANEAYITNFQLYKEEFGSSYTYDKNGNIATAENVAKEKSNFEIDKKNDLIKTTDAKGNVTEYKYDDNHNVKKATTAENIVYNFEYDGKGNPKVSKIENGASVIKLEATYTTSQNYIKTLKDSLENEVTYNWNETKGVLDSLKDPKGGVTSYQYDNLNRLEKVYKTVTNGGSSKVATNAYTYIHDKINTIAHNGFSYAFGYDSLGNNTSVSAAGKNLITNTYKIEQGTNGVNYNTGLLEQSTYGNGQVVKNNYDNYSRLTDKQYKGDTKFTYAYDYEGNLTQHEDKVNTVTYKYIYDIANRLVRTEDNKGNSFGYNYDVNSNKNEFVDKIGENVYLTRYGYDKDNRPSYVNYNRASMNTKGEYFKLSSSTTGSKGTKPVSEAPAFQSENGESVFSSNGSNNVMYNLGINKNAGTMSMWFKTKDTGVRQIFANEGSAKQILNVYLDASNKIKVAVRKNNDEFVELITSDAAVSNNEWNFVSLSWKSSGSTLNCTLYVNGKAYSKPISDFKDFTGGKTALGSSINAAYSLSGYIKGFNYAAEELTNSDIAALYGNQISYKYDSLGRLENKELNTGLFKYNTAYTYKAGLEANVTTKVESINNNGNIISCFYDKNGNIQHIKEGTKDLVYYYDELNELINETHKENGVVVKTITYVYDVGGNINSKTERNAQGTIIKQDNFTYDGVWKDEIDTINGTKVQSDNIGNLTNDGVYTYTWEFGRQLSSMTKQGTNINFLYNDAGIRTQKKVNNETTNYRLAGDKVTYEENGTDKIYYTYDASGHLLSMNLNGVEYYYIRNAQGDIIGLYDKSGAPVVDYSYDAWGKLLSIGGSLKDSVGIKNPYRYRGYRYDNETGLYYLQSRYYNPSWGRFINADALVGATGELLGHNMFAYCKNNFVNKHDPSGFHQDDMGIAENNGCTKTQLMLDNLVEFTGSKTGGAIASAGDSNIGYAVSKEWNKMIFKPKSFSRAIECNLGKMYAASTFTKYAGVLGVAATGIGIWDNFAHYENAWGRTAVDTGVFAAGILVGGILATFGTPFVAAAVISLGAGYLLTKGGNVVKDTWFSRRK